MRADIERLVAVMRPAGPRAIAGYALDSNVGGGVVLIALDVGAMSRGRRTMGD